MQNAVWRPFRGLRWWSGSMGAKKGGLAGWGTKEFFIGVGRGQVGGIDGAGWPLTWGRAGGGSVSPLKPLWVAGSRCEAWHCLWHTRGLEWHWPGCNNTKHTQIQKNLKHTHTSFSWEGQIFIHTSSRICNFESSAASWQDADTYYLPINALWSPQQINKRDQVQIRLLIGRGCYTIKDRGRGCRQLRVSRGSRAPTVG